MKIKANGFEFSPQQLAHVAKRGTQTSVKLTEGEECPVIATDDLHKFPVLTPISGRLHQIGGPAIKGKNFEAVVVSKFLLKLAPAAPQAEEVIPQPIGKTVPASATSEWKPRPKLSVGPAPVFTQPAMRRRF
jgi:hypothetical protein